MEQVESKGQDPEEENKVEDKKFTETVREDPEKVTQNVKPDELHENLVHGKPEQTEIESSENVGNEV